jgi:hypothetical protein
MSGLTRSCPLEGGRGAPKAVARDTRVELLEAAVVCSLGMAMPVSRSARSCARGLSESVICKHFANKDDHEIGIFRETNFALTRYFALWGWRELATLCLPDPVSSVVEGERPFIDVRVDRRNALRSVGLVRSWSVVPIPLAGAARLRSPPRRRVRVETVG